jgi:uncharacterized protein
MAGGLGPQEAVRASKRARTLTAGAAVVENGAMTSPMDTAEFDELDAILDDLRTRQDETPQWEFCEGFMAALICCRRAIPAEEYLAVLLDVEPGAATDALPPRFTALWQRRWQEVSTALDTPVDNLADDAAYHPEVLDVRGAVAQLPPEERNEVPGEALPAYGQVWALGFMYAVENWPDEWVPPRDKAAAKVLDESLDALVQMTEDDTDPPVVSVSGADDQDGPPSVSEQRIGAFADAIWAVYDLRDLWRNIGPRVETVHKAPTPGRNDPCHCGSGKKFKKCHGVG